MVCWCVLRSAWPPRHLVYCCLWQNPFRALSFLYSSVTSWLPDPTGLAVGMGVGQALLLLLAACAVMPAKDPLLNICMDAKHHKTKPGPEGMLHDQV